MDRRTGDFDALQLVFGSAATLSACAFADMSAPTARPAALKAASLRLRHTSIYSIPKVIFVAMLTRIIIIYIAVPFRIQRLSIANIAFWSLSQAILPNLT